jgi:hypothetical protein
MLLGRPVDVEEQYLMTLARSSPRWRVAGGGLIAVLVLTLVLGTSAGRGTAAEVLAEFRSERLAATSLSTGQIANIHETLSELKQLGTVQGIDTAPEMRRVDSIAEASQFVGFTVLEPDSAELPAGISGTPASIRVAPAHEFRFTFEREKALTWYQSIGRGDVSLPERFDGATLVVTTPPGVLLEYRRADQPADGPLGIGLLIGQAGIVTAGTEGDVTLGELRDFLLELPGLSPETAQQLRAIDDWRTTLPIPLPAGRIDWERATIAGSSGLLLNDNTGLGSAALWQQDERIFAIAGAMKAREVQRVADTLR